MKRGFGFVLVVILFSVAFVPGVSAQSSTGTGALSERALSAVDTVGSTQLYFTFLSLGLLADGYAKGVYDRTTALSLIEEIKSLSASAQKALAQVNSGNDVSEEVAALLVDMGDALDALSSQADGLAAFVEQKDDGTSFQTHRQAAWQKISAILGIAGAGTSD
ncbi:hypothetical protein [Salinispira pacifica]